jgi:hypothetical protein
MAINNATGTKERSGGNDAHGLEAVKKSRSKCAKKSEKMGVSRVGARAAVAGAKSRMI